MAEDMMNEEMTGMAAPATEEPAPAEESTSKFDMEILMGNFMDMDDDSRKKATALLASPAASLFDQIVGEPIMARLIEQLDKPIKGEGEPAPEGDGMMTPTTNEEPAPLV